jgi:dTDP-4-dehydrorhamnose 3,5-epimerase
MEFRRLHIPDVVLIVPPRFEDKRGWFMESYNAARLAERGIKNEFLQDNQAFSRDAGTVRGLHFQRPPAAQAKLVRVLRGAIYDVAVDLRKKSATYGKFAAAKLSAKGGEQLFIPAGFAHGYCTLENETEVLYKVDAGYAPGAEGGIVWNDPDLKISWPVDPKNVFLSEKDLALPHFRDFESPF